MSDNMNENKKQFRLSRLIVIIAIMLVIVGIVLGMYWGLDLDDKFKDQQSIKETLQAYGNLSRIMYVLFHFVQSTFIPISNFPTIVAGGFLFGPWENAFLTSIGVILGSLTAFGIGKLFGRKAVEWVVGEENTRKLLETFAGKEKIVLILIFLLPLLPDDIVCFIAGITLISWGFFAVTVVLLRPIPIILMCTFGSGEIIPFKGYGLIVWGVIILFCIFAGGYLWRNWTKVNAFLEKVNDSFTRKKE